VGQPSPWRGRGPGWGAKAVHPTLRSLGLHKGFDEEVSGLGVEGQGIAQRLQVGALLQERLLQAHAARVEVLLEGGDSRRVLSSSARGPPVSPQVCASGLGALRVTPSYPRVPSP